jgi:hypothetical protein
VVSKSKFQKLIERSKTDFARRDPILCNLLIVDQGFLPRDTIEKLRTIGSLLAKSVQPI